MREGDSTLDRPIFVIGTGRSGTTLLFNLLAFHSALGWFSTYNERFPRFQWLSVLNRVHDLSLLDPWTRRGVRWFPRPTESYRMLDRCTQSKFTLRRDLTEEDAHEELQRTFRAIVARQLVLQGKPRFLTKYTGLPRIDFVRAVFPDAFFVHVYRDGRAVVNSLLRVGWWSGDLSAWRYGPIRPEYMEEYRRSGQQRVVLAGIAWKTLMDEIAEQRARVPASRTIEVRYDALVRDHRAVLEEICQACELEPNDRFLRRVGHYRVADMDEKWKSQLTSNELQLLEGTIGAHLERYGFVR
jgi:hypothetical protein